MYNNYLATIYKNVVYLFASVISITPLQAKISYQVTSNTLHDSVIKDRIFSKQIKTVKLHKNGWELSYPVIRITKEEQLLLSFDDLGDEIQYYSYRFLYCNADWREADLYYEEFIDGFEINPINNPLNSTNTFHPYIHYELELPNEDVDFKLPGNYAILVMNDNTQQPIFIRRFFVISDDVSIDANVIKPLNPAFSDTHQEINLSVEVPSGFMDNAMQQISVNIHQNGRWDIAKENIKPDYILNNTLAFNSNNDLLFAGGDEFHYFDIKSVKFQSDRVEHIDYQSPYYHIYLKPDELNRFARYSYHEDLNGKYLVKNDLGLDSRNDADYISVHFSVPREFPITGIRLFVTGDFCFWSPTETEELHYNTAENAYQGEILLKQGYYNYTYSIRDLKSGRNLSEEEMANSYQTENDYLIFVYKRDYLRDIDLLCGFKIVNSMRK